MSLSDCSKCWDTPCRCPDGEIGQLKARIKALEAKVNELRLESIAQQKELTPLREVAEAAVGVYRITERDTVFHNELRDALQAAGYNGEGE